MSTNLSKQKRKDLTDKIKAIHKYIATAKPDENTRQFLVWLSEIEKEINTKKFGLVFEEHREAIDETLETHTPVLTENKKLFIDNGGQVNFLIEGDNLAALKLLLKTHKGKVDVIYIDPPYNTGNKSWKYDNDYIEKDDAYRHSKWLSFMTKRIELAKQLLSKTGIFICAIDDYEFAELKLLLDSIFGEQNRLGNVVIVHNPRGRNDDKYFATMHEYALFYSKGNDAEIKKFEHTEENLDKEFQYEDIISRYGLVSYMRTGNNSDRHTRPNLYYPIYISKNNDISTENKKGWSEIYPINSKGQEKTWRWSKDTLDKKIEDILVKKTKTGISLFKKRRPEIVGGKKPKTVWYNPKYDASSHGISLLEKIFGQKDTFPYPKSFFNILDILKITTDKNSIILDFFAGSGTTGHAVMELNKEFYGGGGGGEERILFFLTQKEKKYGRGVTFYHIKGSLKKKK
jgi:adenine-specific DNA-methyltransferase